MKIKVNIKSLMLLALFTVLSNFAMAQRTISGMVTDGENNEPLVGASVVVTGTTKGTLTDIDGKYSLSDVPANATSLTFSFTGYSNLTINLGTSNVVDAKLKGGTLLEEVVVNAGYGSVRKVDATGAVNSVGEKDFNKGINTSVEQLMLGRVAGVNITQNSGQPGGGINIRIRGTSSVRNGNNPLFVVDGVAISDDNPTGGAGSALGSSSPKNPLNFLSPNDIEKIDILKDASATAIYGARGANGVVLITTKKGKGKGTLEYNYSFGMSNITKKYDLLSPSAYKAANAAAGKTGYDLGANNDWQDVMFRTGLAHDNNLTYGGGTDKGSYRFSFGYLNQEGIIVNSAIKRYSARFNGEQKFMNDKLNLAVNLSVAQVHDDNVPVTDNGGYTGDLLGAILKSNPTIPIYKYKPSSTKLDCDTCTIYQPANASEASPAAISKYNLDYTNTLKSLGSISATYKIIDGLDFKTIIGFEQSMSSRKNAYSRLLNFANLGNGRLNLLDIQINNKSMENYFNYNKKFGNVNFTGLLGYSYQSYGYAFSSIDFSNFNTDDPALMIGNIGSVNYDKSAQTGGAAAAGSANIKDELQSYFARVNFSISDKYLLTASMRRDGSTRFGGSNVYGNFPSFALKWRLSEEPFIPKNIFSDLGLRIGYGVTGNQAIPHNLYSARQRYNGYGFDAGGGLNGGGLNAVAFANPNLKWESTAQTNIGLDYGFANNRVYGSIDIYDKHTKDLLIQVTSAQPAVTPFVWKNLDADVQNRGVELSLNVVAVDHKDGLRWDIGFNVANNKNVVKNFQGLINTGEISGQGLTGAFAQRIAQGQPLFAFFVRPFGGFDKDGNSLYPQGDVQQFTGASPLPTITGGLTNTFNFKNFDASIFFNGVFGNYIYNNTENAYFTKGAFANGRNVTTDIPSNAEGGLNAPDVSSRFLYKGDFIRLQNLSLGYRLPISNSNKVIRSARIFVSGQNILTITKYPGQDPEVNTNKQINGVPSFGIDYTAYPRTKTWTVGLNVSF